MIFSQWPRLLSAATLCLSTTALAVASLFATPAMAKPDHSFSASLSLTGSTETSTLDPVPDPGPAHPPRPFAHPCGVAVDPNGYVYVASLGDFDQASTFVRGRIDIFNPAGEFQVEIETPPSSEDPPPPSNQPCDVAVDSAGTVYVDLRRANEWFESRGVVRFTPSSYPPSPSVTYGTPSMVVPDGAAFPTSMAVDPQNDHLLVSMDGFGSQVTEYSSAAEGNAFLRNIGEGVLHQPKGVAVDSTTGEIFVGSVCTGCPTNPTSSQKYVSVVYVFDSSGTKTGEIAGSETPEGGFLSPGGNVYPAVDESSGEVFVDDVFGSGHVYRFDPVGSSYDYRPDPDLEEHSLVGDNSRVAVSNGPSNPTRGNVYVSSANTSGHLFAFVPTEVSAPAVSGTSVQPSLNDFSASAQVNPDGAATSYRFEYVDDATYRRDVEEAGAEHGFDHAAVAGEGLLPAGGQPAPVSGSATGLTPGTAYRLRVTAGNHCDPSDPETLCVSHGTELLFATYPAEETTGPCPNEPVRRGLSAALPDCRAYELVTPPDTNGHYPKASLGGVSTELATADGNDLLFTTEGGSLTGIAPGAGSFSDAYETTRSSSGWATRLAGPTGAQSQNPTFGAASSDHGYWFWETGNENDHGSLALVAGTGYVRQPDGSFRLVGEGPLATDPRVKGAYASAGGSHLIFYTPSDSPPLAPGASPKGASTIYDRTADGVTHVVSLKPNGQAPQGGAAVRYRGASADGSAVAFTVTEKDPTTLEDVTTLYERRDDATTLAVATGATEFAGLSSGGGRLTYVKEGNLFSFDAADLITTPIGSGGRSIPVNVSATGERVYFVAKKVLAPGSGAIPGGDNFYVWDGAIGAIHFIGTLTNLDLEGIPKVGFEPEYGLGSWVEAIDPLDGNHGLARDPSRTTPDGAAIVFESHADLTSYDAEGNSEVYRYDLGASPPLTCLSCNPTLLPPTGNSHLQDSGSDHLPPTAPGTPVRNISDDGRTVFFQSPDRLVPRDVDGVEDVYEWRAEGKSGCTRPGGCLALISSGQSRVLSYLFAATPSGNDVFFETADLLTGADHDTTGSIYDARVGGGFPEADERSCVGEACKEQPTPPPVLAQPATTAPHARSGHCRRGRHRAHRKGKSRCVKNGHRKHHRRAGHRGQRGGSR